MPVKGRKRLAFALLLLSLCLFTVRVFAAGTLSAPATAKKATPKYHALLIGEQRFLWYGTDQDGQEDPANDCWLDDLDQRNIGDVRNMAEMLKTVAGPEGSQFETTQKFNLSQSGILDAIQRTFAGTTDQDLSIVFIATHGYEKGDGDLRMAFTGNPASADDTAAYWDERYLPFSTLANWLTAHVKGRVFVILESCGSGSSIYAEGVPENKGKLRKKAIDDGEAFVQKAVETFAAADPGIGNPAESGLLRSTGDLRQPKFYVLAAARHHEMSYGWETFEAKTSFNFFTRFLIRGIGKKDNSPADTNKDNYLTLTEMFEYVKQYNTFTVEGVTLSQHVQRYPIDNQDRLLKLLGPEPTATPKPVPRTGDSGQPLVWAGMILAGLLLAFLFPIKPSCWKQKGKTE